MHIIIPLWKASELIQFCDIQDTCVCLYSRTDLNRAVYSDKEQLVDEFESWTCLTAFDFKRVMS